MIISILQENLLKALTRTGRILSSKPQLPITQSVLLTTKEGRLCAVTTNLETTERVWVGAKVEKEGGACVSSRLLTELVLTLPTETARLQGVDGGLSVSCAGFKASLPGVPTQEFPPTPEIKEKDREKTNKDTFAGALSLVLFAAATDEGRPMLTGARFLTEGKTTTIAATDGYRLSLKKIPAMSREDLD